MAFFRKFNTKAKDIENTGFGTNASLYGGRFIDKDGNANVRKTGLPFFESISWFHTMLSIPSWKFYLVIFLFYFGVNFLFANLYLYIGIENLVGTQKGSLLSNFGEAFFFSTQTFTTVGYGHISPKGFGASFLAAVEALIGLLSFALATGLLYGRFSRPKAFILFSENALISPYKENKALMLRMVPHKNTNLFDLDAKVTLGIQIEKDGEVSNKFYPLDLEISQLNSLNLNWTLVHYITESSPLYNLDKQDYSVTKGEIIVFIKAFDDMFSNTVMKRTSYTFDEVVFNAKFSPMFYGNDNKTIIDIDNLNKYELL